MATIYIDPSAAAGGDGSLAKPFQSWSRASFRPGNTYLQKSGTVAAGGIYVGVSGTAFSHIVIGAYGPGAPPMLNGTVNIDGASYVDVSGFTIRGGAAAGVVIQNGAHDVAIKNNVIQDSHTGIWIGSDAGGNSIIQHNQILQSAKSGIVVNTENGNTANPTKIVNNTVYLSGSHGIDIEANYVTVDGNFLVASGQTVPGSTGIHVYSTSVGGVGNFNTISNNVAFSNSDRWGYDGNGIELDQYTHDNAVTNNFSYLNDGAGIAVYDSYNNTITGNVMVANELDSGHTHTRKGELVLNESLNLTKDDVIAGNTILSAFYDVPAVLAADDAAVSRNTFSNNVAENLAGGILFTWGRKSGAAKSEWNQYAPTDRTSGIPMFSAGSYDGTYDFDLTGSGSVTLDGHDVRLIGWSATAHGLGVDYL